MSAPPVPTIFIRPKPYLSSIVYTVNPNNATTSTFLLTVSGPGASNYNFLPDASWYKYTVPNLNSNTQYSAQVLQIDSNGFSSDPTSFRTVYTGLKPSVVQNFSTTAIVGSNATLSWNAPVSDGGAPIGWYVIRNLTNSIKYNTVASARSFIAPLSTGNNLFSVEAVNDPGYSPRAYASTIVTSYVSFNWILNQYIQLASNAVISDPAVYDWYAYATSDTTRQTNFTITGSPQQTNLQSMFGMSDSSNPAFPVYNHMPHCIYTAANGNLYLFDYGGFGPNLGSYNAGDLLTMVFSGSNATYKQNGTTIYTKTFTPSLNLHLCATAGIANAQYSNITFFDN